MRMAVRGAGEIKWLNNEVSCLRQVLWHRYGVFIFCWDGGGGGVGFWLT